MAGLPTPVEIEQNWLGTMDDHYRQMLLLGREHFERGEHDKAESLLRQVVAKAERFADVHHLLGMIAHSRGDFVGAEQCFERALAINPNYTEAQLNLTVTYNELGKYADARRLYAQVVDSARPEPINPFVKGRIANLHAQVAQAYLDAGMQREAATELSKALTLCSDYADLHLRLGLVYRELGAALEARVEFEAARQINPHYAAARLALGTLLLSSGEQMAARREFEAVLEIDPEHKTATTYLRLMAMSNQQLSRPKGAIATGNVGTMPEMLEAVLNSGVSPTAEDGT